MPAHQWRDHDPGIDNAAEALLSDRHRKCELCGKVQHEEVQYNWMRVTGRRWRPLVGRCSGNIKGGGNDAGT